MGISGYLDLKMCLELHAAPRTDRHGEKKISNVRERQMACEKPQQMLKESAGKDRDDV